jgi:hypothetical protein
MFESKSEIEPFLSEAGLGAFAEAIAGLCVPAIRFEAVAGAGRAGATQFGGSPALPSAQAWPVRPAYSNGKVIADKLGGREPELLRAFQQEMPMHFVAQIDLGAVSHSKALARADSRIVDGCCFSGMRNAGRGLKIPSPVA